MKTYRALALLTIFFLLLLSTSLQASAAWRKNTPTQQEADTAEVSVFPVGAQPLITPNQETIIPLHFEDVFGFNYTQWSHGIMGFLRTKVFWPLIHPSWRPFLGYSTIVFTADMVGDTTGWSVGINPTSVPESTDGTSATLQLKVFVNDLSAQNTALVHITATRVLTDGSSYGISEFDIPVRSTIVNSIQVTPDQPIKIASPGTIVPFTINIKNQGYYTDSFQINVIQDPVLSANLNTQSIVLSPGQSGDVTLSVQTPEAFFDPGTSYPINITVTSLNHGGGSFYGGVQVRISGFYLSGLAYAGIGAGLLFTFLILFLIFIVFERRSREVHGKPAKPWKIPEEQAHLMELKQSSPEAYDQERAAMTQEYNSALAFYKDSRKTTRFQSKELKQKKPLLAPLSKRLKSVHLPKRQKAKTKPKKIKEEPVTTAATSTVDTERDKALQRFQKEQAKQQRRK